VTPPLLSARDIAFQLYDVLGTDALVSRARFSAYSREAFDAVIETAAAIATEEIAPHNRRNDTEEPRFEDGRVLIQPDVKRGVAAMAEAGILAATNDEALGGMQLPHSVATAAMAWFEAASVGTSAYALLTTGAANVLAVFGTPDQHERFVKPMLAGRFFGTMALTEPEAGSSLADIRTTATPVGDGTYRLTGTKMWISGGEHDMGDNIVHLVLARIEGAPAGVKGISLFAVPKYRVAGDGAIGERNGVVLGGIIHKMGWRGTVSTILNFGETAPCIGELVGEPHRGLSYMFHMMNEARIGVGRSAMAMGTAAYHYSLDYARTRRQGRRPGEKDPSAPPIPIIEHPDVRRLLLSQKATVEGALALILECARLVDDQETAESEAERATATMLLEVLTPIAKSFPSEACQQSISNAIQVLGGYGFAREYPVEQYYRDNRLNALHEGTTGIQALDLLGRKVMLQDGAALKALVARIAATGAEAAAIPTLAPYVFALATAVERWVAATRTLGGAAASGSPAKAFANASVYLDVASTIVVSWLWLRQAVVAERALIAEPDGTDADFYRGKLQAAHYWFAWELPKTGAAIELLSRLDTVPYDMAPEWF
jgi:butyryl-CoA dehydrogenase